jgi:hypothetical protein
MRLDQPKQTHTSILVCLLMGFIPNIKGLMFTLRSVFSIAMVVFPKQHVPACVFSSGRIEL